MMFSTKAEYGVRVMIELGRHYGQGPLPLTAIAEKEELPLAYLEHLVARLRKAGLVDSQRGAHGGYRLARDPEEIQMAEVVQSLEGLIVPMECFIKKEADGKVLCNHQQDSDRSCSTKLLWHRVLESVMTSLKETKLSELVEFANKQEQQLVVTAA